MKLGEFKELTKHLSDDYELCRLKHDEGTIKRVKVLGVRINNSGQYFDAEDKSQIGKTITLE